MTEQELTRLGRRISQRRRIMGLTQRALAAQVGIAHTWLHRLERGEFAEPDPAKIARVFDALQLAASKRMSGELAGRLPELRTYFRAKYDLSPDQAAQVERYVEKLRRRP